MAAEADLRKAKVASHRSSAPAYGKLRDKILEATPSSNVEGFCILYCLENLLRELLVEELSSQYGPKWYNVALPPDVLVTYRSGRELERSIPWQDLTPRHPVYYLDFPDLRKTIESNRNWVECFSHLFRSKSHFSSLLSDVEPLRNAIAHNRVLAPQDVIFLLRAMSHLTTCLGPTRSAELVHRSTEAKDVASLLSGQLEAGRMVWAAMSTLSKIPAVYLGILNWVEPWWYDADYLGIATDDIEPFRATALAYDKLPRIRGSALSMKRWIEDRNAKEHWNRFEQALVSVLGRGGQT
jgi:hypothetical protein